VTRGRRLLRRALVRGPDGPERWVAKEQPRRTGAAREVPREDPGLDSTYRRLLPPSFHPVNRVRDDVADLNGNDSAW